MSSSVSERPPIIIPAQDNQTATLIFFHGLGDQGDGWSSIFRQEMRLGYFKYVIPNAASRAVTLNYGMRMPAWYDIYGLTADAREDDVGIEQAKQYVHQLIDAEIAAGIPSERIVLGGFSMGAALAIYAGLTYTKPLGCVISFSGFLLQRERIAAQSTVNRNLPIFLGHGQNDFLVPLVIGQMTEAALKAINSNVVLKTYPVDHSTTRQEQDDAMNFLKQHVEKK